VKCCHALGSLRLGLVDVNPWEVLAIHSQTVDCGNAVGTLNAGKGCRVHPALCELRQDTRITIFDDALISAFVYHRTDFVKETRLFGFLKITEGVEKFAR
jgi:hypothetical protein